MEMGCNISHLVEGASCEKEGGIKGRLEKRGKIEGRF